MLSRFKGTPPGMVAVCYSLMLALLLVACGGGTTSAPTPTPTPRPSPTPALTVYRGTGYSISYPKDWTVTPGDHNVTFKGAGGLYTFIVGTEPDPGGSIDANTLAGKAIEGAKTQVKNIQTVPLPPTTTVGGDSWVQKSITGTETSTGQGLALQLVVLSDNHPAHATNTQIFTIVYDTEKSLFATTSTSYFQPMLQSFKFT
jgi:hypothetical protein